MYHYWAPPLTAPAHLEGSIARPSVYVPGATDDPVLAVWPVAALQAPLEQVYLPQVAPHCHAQILIWGGS